MEKNRVLNKAARMPAAMQQKLAFPIDDLRDKGPVRAEWPNYSVLGQNRHHCHIGCKWVACWRHEAESIEIEEYYAGSREDAPY